ncbi:hypothetical protein BDV95DRAFT_583342 [Massariosphaeria phaeospora]|uniref:Uncharacterized protein n=1 Tax=Massariosphaeria phaeospora TaxID=100035 RepID=A0A7C8I7A2_9PLEO|nr:hypothetical protein BDV95DRAFT_583342 [Massariosphaeria phaeospora]
MAQNYSVFGILIFWVFWILLPYIKLNPIQTSAEIEAELDEVKVAVTDAIDPEDSNTLTTPKHQSVRKTAKDSAWISSKTLENIHKSSLKVFPLLVTAVILGTIANLEHETLNVLVGGFLVLQALNVKFAGHDIESGIWAISVIPLLYIIGQSGELLRNKIILNY